MEGEPLQFGFKDSNNGHYRFQVSSPNAKSLWVSDLLSILSSQERMMKGEEAVCLGEIFSTTLLLQPPLPLHSHTPIHIHTHINTKL